MAGRQVFDLIRDVVPFAQAYIFSTLPRGSVHIVQPGRCPESLLKAYARDFHKEDRVTWQTVVRSHATRIGDSWSREEFENSPYLHAMLQPNDLRYAVGIPLAAPVLNGYPGAVVVFRGPDDSDFTDAEFHKLRNLGRQLDEFIDKHRPQRNEELETNRDPWQHTAEVRQFIYGKDGKLLFPRKAAGLDSRVEEQLNEHARQALEHSRRGQTYADRLMLPDERGDLWIFHCAAFRDFPALGPGPVVFFTLQPESHEWVAVRPSDVAADAEMVRLLPTLKFMQQEFANNPTLEDIAKRAHLSPFHFHRRFTDLIGMTPKHFLLGCQIHEAKRLLAGRRRELAQIATDCGFAHQSHFTSRFKQATGLTPTRWRRVATERGK